MRPGAGSSLTSISAIGSRAARRCPTNRAFVPWKRSARAAGGGYSVSAANVRRERSSRAAPIVRRLRLSFGGANDLQQLMLAELADGLRFTRKPAPDKILRELFR